MSDSSLQIRSRKSDLKLPPSIHFLRNTYGKPFYNTLRSWDTRFLYTLYNKSIKLLMWLIHILRQICCSFFKNTIHPRYSTRDQWFRPYVYSLVTQPMLQCRPNQTELRLMDSYIQILCRFQKCKFLHHPPSVLKN